MIHVLYFITRKSGMDAEAFHRYWREVHAPIVVQIPQLRRYVQSHRIDAERTDSAYDDNVSSYDGVAEVHLDGLEAFGALRKTPQYLEGALADEQNFLDLTRVEWMATTDHVMLDGPTGGTLVKGVWQLKRKPGMSVADFRRYWIEVHGQLGRALPGLRRYVQSHLIDEAYLYAEPRHDGVAQLWFDSAAALAAAFDSPAGKDVQADGPKMLDMRLLRFFLADENVVIASR
jgi:uncharacterized protein (TIGR02118 family)